MPTFRISFSPHHRFIMISCWLHLCLLLRGCSSFTGKGLAHRKSNSYIGRRRLSSLFVVSNHERGVADDGTSRQAIAPPSLSAGTSETILVPRHYKDTKDSDNLFAYPSLLHNI